MYSAAYKMLYIHLTLFTLGGRSEFSVHGQAHRDQELKITVWDEVPCGWTSLNMADQSIVLQDHVKTLRGNDDFLGRLSVTSLGFKFRDIFPENHQGSSKRVQHQPSHKTTRYHQPSHLVCPGFYELDPSGTGGISAINTI